MPKSHKRISPARLAANRANAAKSTGPRSAEGKARSAQNALKHGFTGSAFAVTRPEDFQEVANFKQDLVALHQPVDARELLALEPIALARQTLLRAARLEAGLFTACFNESGDSLGKPVAVGNGKTGGNGDAQIACPRDRSLVLGDGFLRMERRTRFWPLLLRYKAQAERDYRRAVAGFDRLKALRGKSPNEPILEPQPPQNETTCAARETASFPFPASSSGPAPQPLPGLAGRSQETVCGALAGPTIPFDPADSSADDGV